MLKEHNDPQTMQSILPLILDTPQPQPESGNLDVYPTSTPQLSLR